MYDKVKWKETCDEELEKVGDFAHFIFHHPLTIHQELLDMERKAVKLMTSYKIGLLYVLLRGFSLQLTRAHTQVVLG